MGASTHRLVQHHYRKLCSIAAIAVVFLLCCSATAIDARDTETFGSNELTSSGEQLVAEQRHQMSDLAGGEITGERVLRRSDSPFLLRSDLEVAHGAKLTVEPGVTVHVAPMVGITVYGALVALVSHKRT